MDTQEKLQKIMEKHTEFRADLNQSLSAAEKKLREAIGISSFGENDIIKKIRQTYLRYIKEINQVLVEKQELSEADRLRLFDKRRMYLDFLQLFTSAEITIDNINKWIDDEFVDILE